MDPRDPRHVRQLDQALTDSAARVQRLREIAATRRANVTSVTQKPKRKRRETPRLTDAIVGYRAWRVDAYGNLCALTEEWAWPTGVATAACWYEAHQAPVRDANVCGCGLYARFNPAYLAEYDDADVTAGFGAMMPVVMGAVAFWGRCEVHHDGVRAEHARVVALTLPADANDDLREVFARVAARYGVPLVPRAALEFEALRWGAPVPDDLRPPKPPPPKYEPYHGYSRVGGGYIGIGRTYSAPVYSAPRYPTYPPANDPPGDGLPF
jgi:hypothetical protein